MSKYLTIPRNFSCDEYYRFRKLNKLIQEILKTKIGQKITILDIGCGDGQFLKYIKKNVSKDLIIEYYGIDAFVHEKSFNFELLNEDAERKFSLPDKFADIIICGEIIEHISNTDGFIEEVYRILKSDGDAIITTPNLSSYFNRFLLLFGYQPYHSEVSNKESGFGLGLIYKILGRSKYGNKTAGHLRIFTLKALREFIEFYGFKTVKYYPAYFSSFRKDNNRKSIIKIFFAFDRIVSSVFPSLATGLIIHFKKK